MAKLFVEIGAKVGEFQKALNQIERRVNRFSRNMERLGTNLTQSITLPLAALGGASVGAFASFERLEKGLIAVTGDATRAAAEMENLKKSAQLPGLGFEEAVKGSIRLQAVGLSADEARRTLEVFGTAIAATGGNAQNLDSVQYQLTQMISKNRILQEDFGILQENVPLLGKALEAAFGTTNLDAIRETGISAQDFNARLVAGLAGLKELENVTGGLGNAFDNFGDSVKFSLVELGRSVATALNLEANLGKVASVIDRVASAFSGLTPELQATIVTVAAVVAAIGPLLLIIGKLSSLIPVLVSGLSTIGGAFAFILSPAGLVVATLGLIVAAFIELRINSDRWARSQSAANGTLFETGRATKVFSDITKQATSQTAAQVAVIDNLVRVAQDESAATTVRTEALKKLKSEYPDYFGQISTDLSQTDKLTEAKKRLTDSILNQAKAQAAQGKITELETEKLSIQEQVTAAQGQQQKVLNELRRQGFDSIQAAVQASYQNREAIAQQAASTRGVNSALLDQGKNLASLIGQYQSAGSVISNANESLTDLSDTQRKLAEQAASGINIAPTVAGAATIDTSGTSSGVKRALEDFERLREKITELPKIETKNLIPDSIAPATSAIADQVNRLSGSLQLLGIDADSMIVIQERAQSLLEELQPLTDLLSGPIQDGFSSLFTTLIEGGANAFGGFLKSLKSLITQLITAVATAAALSLILNAITGGAAGGFKGVFKSILGGGGIGGIFKLIPGFAEGGIVPPGYPNDSYFARLTSNEAVIPLNKLDKYVGGDSAPLTGEIRLSGNDLVVALERFQNNRERTRGR